MADKTPVKIKVNNITASKTVNGWWINPLNGERTKIGIYKTPGNKTFMLPEGCQDGVLFIENQ
jgi:hypothetical protein